MDGDGSISVEDYLVWNINDYYQGNVGGDVTGDGQLTPADSNVVLNCALTQGSCQAASYATTLYYVHNDHLGTPKMLTDTSGAPVWRAIARPFGKATVNDDVDGDGVSVEFNLRQPGQYYDRETGLYYNYYRYYDPETGRYITSDPIGLAAGVNTYAYVRNNPLNLIDPYGLFDVNTGAGVSGGIHVIGIGLNGSVGGVINSSGQACVSASACVRIGPGAYVGGGGYVSGGAGASGEGGAITIGVGGDVGAGATAGGQVTGGNGGVNAAKAKGGVGAGFSVGFDICLSGNMSCTPIPDPKPEPKPTPNDC